MPNVQSFMNPYGSGLRLSARERAEFFAVQMAIDLTALFSLLRCLEKLGTNRSAAIVGSRCRKASDYTAGVRARTPTELSLLDTDVT
jgi:hypothetical protein